MGFLGKINRIYIAIAAGVIILGMLVAFVMLVFQPRTNEINAKRAQREAKAKEAAAMPQKFVDLAQAQAAYEKNRADFDVFMAKQPKISIQPIDGMKDLWREFGVEFGPAILRFVQGTGNTPIGVTAPPPPAKLFSPPVPCITVPAQGFGIHSKSFPKIVNFFRVLGNCPRLAVASGGIRISGQSPDLTAMFPLTFYVLTEAARPENAKAVSAVPGAPTAGRPAGRPGGAPTLAGRKGKLL